MKRAFITGLCLIGLFCNTSLKAMIISSNSGVVADSEIQYNMSLEMVGNRLIMRLVITNKAKDPIYLNTGPLSIPGFTTLFFSTDKLSLESKLSEWRTLSLIPIGTPAHKITKVEPEKSIEAVLEVGEFYDKIYTKMKTDNVYIYWGVTLESSSFRRLPRIGGMLTLPKVKPQEGQAEER
jgi:hypothetical protein